ncbi:conserved exported hypothetical protein [Nostocoides japonicum T1-X7]|uniref:Uncharacterized protein n=1 Tax=Nostocoides japonicum T1-X7 TaxID=1194083 RepID=A0A077LSK1_9MICO|nr:hypothetical protein [Tetrasphaera japonica]CCH75878.1 conserved exported hypothetical protein [Tetrasphaera japonica T1-X7]
MSQARLPRFSRFLWTGGLIGLVAGVIVSLLSGPATGYGDVAGAGYLGLAGIFVGVIVGAAVAAILDRSMSRRNRADRG